nr:unnamed protein product [Callosobruchus chinensis]
MQKIVKTNLKRSSQTRWSAKYVAVDALISNFPQTVKGLREDKQTSHAPEAKYEMETMEFDDFPAIPPRNFYQQRQYLNLSAAIEDLATSDTQNDVEIVIIPPVVDPQTDEETFDDDVIQEEEFAMPLDIVGQV